MRWNPAERLRTATCGTALGGAGVYAWAAAIDAGVLRSPLVITAALAAGIFAMALLERRAAAALLHSVSPAPSERDDVRALVGVPALVIIVAATSFLSHLFGSSWFLRAADGDTSNAKLLVLAAGVSAAYVALNYVIRSRRVACWAARCEGGVSRRITVMHALVLLGVVEISALAIPADGVFGLDQHYELAVEPPAYLRLGADADYRWVSLPDERGARPFRTGAVVIDNRAEIGLIPSVDATGLSFYVGVVPDEYDLRPTSIPPVLVDTTTPRDVAARVVVERKNSATGDFSESEFDVPVGTTARRIDIESGPATEDIATTITAIAPEGARVILHGVHRSPAARRPRRIVMISLDTHGARHMSVDRDQAIDTNPALRRLISEDPRAVYFSNAVATSFWTLPTHASVFTGLYPSQHRMFRSSPARMAGNDVEWLTETVRNAGVRTFHLFSHMRLADRYGYHRGTDFYRAYEGKDLPFGRRARRVLGDAVELLGESRRDDVFMFLHLFDAHAPYVNFPPQHDAAEVAQDAHYPEDLYEGPEYRALKASIGSDPRARLAVVGEQSPNYAPHMPAARAAYQLGLRDVDDAIGAFIDQLKERDLYDDTTLIFFGDHGEEFFTHGMLTHSTLYEENLNVPFAVKLAVETPVEVLSSSLNEYQFEAHTTAHRIVHDLFSLDYPEYLSTAANSALSLEELVSLDGHRSAFAEHYAFDPADPFYEAAYLAPDRTKTLLSTRLAPNGRWQLHDEFVQVYDLESDRNELVNLAGSDTVTDERRSRLVERAAAVRALRFANTESSEISTPELERLRALGYF